MLDLAQMMREDLEYAVELFGRTMEYLKDDPLKFITSASTVTEFQIGNIGDALRHLDSNPFLGHVQISGSQKACPTVPVLPEDTTKSVGSVIDPAGSYLLVGGLGGLGRSISELLVSNGARNLIFLSRSGASSSETKAWIEYLHRRGVNTRTCKVDICDKWALCAAVQEALDDEMLPLQGVFQCAAVIKDSVFENMSFSDWMTAFRPKAEGTWNLVEAVEQSSQDPFFIFLASSAGVIGSRGQANYAAGNCFLDSLARCMRLRGKHAVSIDLGPVLGAGMLTEDEVTLDMLRASGFYGIRHEDFLQVIKHAITMEILPGEPAPPQITLGVGTGGLMLQNQPADPYWSRTALYSYLNTVDMPPPDLSQEEAGSKKDIKAMLASCDDADSAASIACTGLTHMLAKSMNMHFEEIDTGKPPNAYGVDSLVAVGVRNWVFTNCDVEVSVFDILSEKTISELAIMIVEKGRFGAGL